MTSKKNAIFELEFFFCDLVLSVCVEGIANGFQLVTYTDIDGVRDAPYCYQTESKNGEPNFEACLKLEYELGLNLWVSRILPLTHMLQMTHLLLAKGLLLRSVDVDVHNTPGMSCWISQMGRLRPAMSSPVKKVHCNST